MVNKITFDDSAHDENKFDLYAGLRKDAKYHSLLGVNQHPDRNAETIKMSSGSAAINIYKNMQSTEVLKSISTKEFNKS
jgi:hypothetical protein